MSANTLNKGGRIARASVIAKLRRLKRSMPTGAAQRASVSAILDHLIEWVNFSASRYKKRPGGLK